MRKSGAPSVRSPRTKASAVSARRVPFKISRSNPSVRNMPHLVGIRVETTCRTSPICTFGDMLVLDFCRDQILRDGASDPTDSLLVVSGCSVQRIRVLTVEHELTSLVMHRRPGGYDACVSVGCQ